MSFKLNKNTKFIILGFKLLLGLVLLLTLYFSIENRTGVYEAFRNANYINLAIAAALIAVNLLLQFIKYNFLLSGAGLNVKIQEILGSLFFGSLLAFVTPGSIGELGKGIYFNKLDKWKATGAVIADKLVNMVSTFLVGSVTFLILLYTRMHIPVYVSGLYLTFFVVSLMILVLILWDPLLLFFIVRKCGFPKKWQLRLLKTFRSLDAIPTTVILKSLGVGLLWVCVIILQYHMVLMGFITCSAGISVLVVPTMLMVKMALPVTLGDLGIREGALVFFYTLFGISNEAVIYTGLIIFIYNMSIPAIIGGFTLKHIKFFQA